MPHYVILDGGFFTRECEIDKTAVLDSEATY